MKTTLSFNVPGVGVSEVVLDATLSSSHSADVDVTEHPVEDGANVSDGARPKQLALQLEAIISDTPLREQPIPIPEEKAQDNAGRARRLFTVLRQVRDAGGVVSLRSDFLNYDNLLIKGLTAPESAKMGRAVRFTLQLVQVRLARSQSVALKKTSTPKAKPKNTDGAKNPEKAPDAVVSKSMWKRATGKDGFITKLSGALGDAGEAIAGGG